MVAKRITAIGIFVLLAMLISLQMVSAAALIHGTIYNLDLKKLEKAVAEISTSPKQRMVSTDGTYAFTVDKGEYIIRAQYKENASLLTTEERVVVKEDGSYVFDLFLLPSFAAEDDILAESALDVDNIFIEEKRFTTYALFGVAGIIVLVVIYVFYKFMNSPERKKKKVSSENEGNNENETEETSTENDEDNEIKKEEDAVAQQVMEFIKEQDGRTTQKELRKQVPLSEGKISLVLTELETAGKIRKIKKGRGNIIILNTKDTKEEKEKEGRHEKQAKKQS
ncbi:MAG: hypothetical protein Q7R76_02835 [Candidatus Woesearchaeota archaeon]|nr:hypothetical protein [Candidatus Woesearchaeota archaeon]